MMNLDQLEKCFSELGPVELNRIVTDAIDSIAFDDIRRVCRAVSPTLGTDKVGREGDTPYVCSWVRNVRSIKESLVTETLKGSADIVVSRISERVGQFVLDRSKDRSRRQLMDLEHIVSKDIFQEAFKIAFNFVISTALPSATPGILASGFSFSTSLAITLPATAAFFGYQLTSTFLRPVDVNSREWRDKVAEEIFNIFLKRKTEHFCIFI